MSAQKTQMEPFAVYEGTTPWRTEAHTHRQAAIRYAERHYGALDGLKDELVLVVVRVGDGARMVCLLKSKVLVQWAAAQVEEAPK